MSEIVHLAGLTLDELISFVVGEGEPKYRAKQLFKGLHSRRLRDFESMTDLPKAFREKLNGLATASTLDVESKYVSEDGTRRFLMNTKDGYPVETVFIPSEGRDTICFSSQ
ncbi:MAG: 23S rRNA (adenine(2503)-C(2))-methyltransferase RlmN, partial [Pyrinomonadaceae bacterium]